jgi:hypothetical protein
MAMERLLSAKNYRKKLWSFSIAYMRRNIMLTLSSGNFDIFKKMLINWGFDPNIRIENSVIHQKITDQAFIAGDLSTILGKNANISMIINKDGQKKLSKLPTAGNPDTEIKESQSFYTVAKGAVTIRLTRLPMRKANFNMPNVSSFIELGTETPVDGKDLKSLMSIIKNQKHIRCYFNDQNELYAFKNADEIQYDLGFTPMLPASPQNQMEQGKNIPAVVLLSFKMPYLFGNKIKIRIFREPFIQDELPESERYWGEFTMEIAGGLTLTLIERLLKAPMRMH